MNMTFLTFAQVYNFFLIHCGKQYNFNALNKTETVN